MGRKMPVIKLQLIVFLSPIDRKDARGVRLIAEHNVT